MDILYFGSDGMIRALGDTNFFSHYNHNHDKLGRFARSAKVHMEFLKKNPLDREAKKDKKNEYRKSGVHEGFRKDQIKKGSTFYRYSSTDNETKSGRKYASVTDYDKNYYKLDALNKRLSNKGRNVYLYELEATKNLKVAKGRKVLERLVDQYGDTEVRNAHKEVNRLKTWDNYQKIFNGLDDHTNDKYWIYDRVSKNNEKVNRFVHDTLYDKNISEEVFKYYRDKGYDAIVDPEDYLDGYYYPMILLNPESSTSKKRVKKINGASK